MKKLFLTIAAIILSATFAQAEITKIVEIDKISVEANGVLNCRQATKIMEDGQVISERYDLITYTPGQDVTTADQAVQDMATHVWTEDVIAQYQAATQGTELTLEQQKTIKAKLLYANIKRFINTLPSGFPRYDDDLKLGLMNAIMSYTMAGQEVPANILAAKNWLQTVQGLFVTQKAAITAAEDAEDLNTINVTVENLEAQYGREGTVLADPAVSTADLM